MTNRIEQLTRGFELGEAQVVENLTLFPLVGGEDAPPDYMTLEEAMGEALIEVSEVNEGGSVPELRVTSRAGRPILLIDGEELIGAKQNRVVNTTILIPPGSVSVIPVSCVEQGRWNYKTEKFAAASNVMPQKGRRGKMRSVSASLHAEGSHRSDQGEVWDEVRELSCMMQSSSPTGAMHDVYNDHRDRMRAFIEGLRPVDGQRGMLVAIDGRAAGLDVLSRPSAWRRVHEKVLTSYVMEALARRRGKPGAAAQPAGRAVAEAFLEAIARCEEKAYASPGLGTDYRYESAQACGSALEFESVIVHAAFFAIDKDEAPRGRMSPMMQRRRQRS